MISILGSSNNFAALSLKDLLQARDLFHFHLMNKQNVVATAVGLYRIRKEDYWSTRESPAGQVRTGRRHPRRTLFNSEVRPYSWPCVYVFVSRWQTEEELISSDPNNVVPKTLYLPDGRTVPVCVIEARRQPRSRDLIVAEDARLPRNLFAPGTPLINRDAQGQVRVATAGCIVRDSERYYVMTNGHVLGKPGTPIFAGTRNEDVRIGVTAEKGLKREDFGAVYPGFASTNQRLLLDIGLVDVRDICAWKTAVPGINQPQPVVDLYDQSFDLALVGQKVVGRAAVSGAVRGEIQALFYRYKSMGGSEYLSDFLIGPEATHISARREQEGRSAERDPDVNVSFGIHHGDSGTLLFIEHRDEKPETAGRGTAKPKLTYHPFALLWGREEFFADDSVTSPPFGLATALSPVLDRLDLDLVQDINLDQRFIWGWQGHYVIGRALEVAADLLTSNKLRRFVTKYRDLLSIDPAAGEANPHVGDDDEPRFVQLADVPDNVWKGGVNSGIGNRHSDDNKNHFADLDLGYEDKGLFIDLCFSDPDTYLNPKAFVAYFASNKPVFERWAKLRHKKSKPAYNAYWGALPFRVHHLFDIMVAAARAGDADRFLCAGGVLIHYVGDACQPLHASIYADGDPESVVPDGEGWKLEAEGLHHDYEAAMIDYGLRSGNLGSRLKTKIAAMASEAIVPIGSGYEASQAIIHLIQATRGTLPPTDILKAWLKAEQNGESKSKVLWQATGPRTIICMARGTRYLAAIWQAAWTAGGGEAHIKLTDVVTPKALMKLYNNPNEMPSVPLDHYPDDPHGDWSRISRPAD